MRYSAPILAFSAALIACAADNRPVDAFNRVIDSEISVPPGPMTDCNRRDFEKPPRIVLAALPLYPMGRLWAGQQDDVKAIFDVSATGKVENLVLKSKNESNPDAFWFRNHVTLAIQAWRLEPASRQGKPVKTTCQMEFSFQNPN
jgi:outer membrane biosynthesis protein TonB